MGEEDGAADPSDSGRVVTGDAMRAACDAALAVMRRAAVKPNRAQRRAAERERRRRL